MSAVGTAPKPASKPTRKPRVKIDADESKSERFSRLGTARVRKALKDISLIGNLTGPGYEYSEEQAANIVTALAEAVRGVQTKFAAKSESADESKGFRV